MRHDKRINFSKFIKKFSSSFQSKETLLVSTLDLHLNNSNNDYGFLKYDILNFDKKITFNQIDSKNISKYDFIVLDIPLMLSNKEPFIYNKLKKVPKTWNILFSVLDYLTDDGTLMVVMPEAVKYNFDLFYDAEGYQVYNNIILKTPDNINPQTGVKTYLLGFQKKFIEKQFIAQIEIDYENDKDNFENILVNYKLGFEKYKTTEIYIENKDYINGFWEKRWDFVSFSKYAFQKRFEKLSKNYTNYKEFELSKVILNDKINIIQKGEFQDTKDAFYIKLIGKITTDYKLENIEKHHHYAQIIINPKIVSLKFLKFFYTSELGIDILNSLKRGLTIQKIYKKDLLKSIVLIPDIKEQNSFIDAHEKLSRIEESIKSLKKELSLNPNTKDEIIKKWDELHRPFVTLTKSDEIRNLISIGENKRIEFKETLRKNIHTNKIDTEIEKTSLKNIVAFLNSDGGTLLIGVSDNGEIKGIENDIFNNKDKYLLHLTNLIKDKIGASFFNLINHDIYEVENKLILMVECKTSKEDVFLNMKGEEEEYYIRTNPSAIRLKGSKLIKYISERKQEFSTSK